MFLNQFSDLFCRFEKKLRVESGEPPHLPSRPRSGRLLWTEAVLTEKNALGFVFLGKCSTIWTDCCNWFIDCCVFFLDNSVEFLFHHLILFRFLLDNISGFICSTHLWQFFHCPVAFLFSAACFSFCVCQHWPRISRLVVVRSCLLKLSDVQSFHPNGIILSRAAQTSPVRSHGGVFDVFFWVSDGVS